MAFRFKTEQKHASNIRETLEENAAILNTDLANSLLYYFSILKPRINHIIY